MATPKHTLAIVSRSIRRRNTLYHFTFQVWLYKIYEGLAWALLKDMQNMFWYGWSKLNNVFCHCPQLGLCHCCHCPILGIIVRYFANVIVVTVLDLQFLTVMCRLCTRSWLKVVLTQDVIESKVFAAGLVPCSGSRAMQEGFSSVTQQVLQLSPRGCHAPLGLSTVTGQLPRIGPTVGHQLVNSTI